MPKLKVYSGILVKNYLYFGFTKFWAVCAMSIGLLTLGQDFRYYFVGIGTEAKAVNYVGSGRNQRPILEFSVNQKQFQIPSLNGNLSLGETRKIYYLAENPESAREAFSFWFDLFWVILGLVIWKVGNLFKPNQTKAN